MKHTTDEATARIERDRAQRVAALLSTPFLADLEVAEVLRLPPSTWKAVKGSLGLRQFKIGRRVYARTADVVALMERLAESGE